MPLRPPINQPMGAIEWLMLIALSVLWGGTFLFAEIALEEVRPFTLVLGRVGIAALILVVVVYATGHRMPRSWTAWLPFLIMGALNNLIPFSLIVWGQTQIASGLAAILNATTPLFGVAIAHVATADEKMTGLRMLGVIIGFAGVVLMILDILGLGRHRVSRAV